MSVRHDLNRLYSQWREISQAESLAISKADWTLLTESQQAKAELQPGITVLTERLRAELEQSQRLKGRVDYALRRTVDELVALERANQSALATRLREVQAEIDRLNSNTRCLRQIHRSYAAKRTAHWHSYS